MTELNNKEYIALLKLLWDKVDSLKTYVHDRPYKNMTVFQAEALLEIYDPILIKVRSILNETKS